MPFLADELWRNLVAGACEGAPDSVHLAGWPETGVVDDALLGEVAAVREIVELGRQVRAEENVKLRQPLRRATVFGALGLEHHADEIRDELRVREVVFEGQQLTKFRYKPDLRVLGPKLGSDLPKVREALARGDYELIPGGLRVQGFDLADSELIPEVEQRAGTASSASYTVELDLELDDELRREGRVYELVHAVNVLRKDRGLDVSDRIALTVPDADLIEEYGERIRAETLATELRPGSELDLEKA
jgi:isoleucyl-tRNA synthetase